MIGEYMHISLGNLTTPLNIPAARREKKILKGL